MLTVPQPIDTIVMEGNSQLLKFEGVLCLPIGTRIHIDNNIGEGETVPLDSELFPNGRADAIVREIKLWGTQSPARALILDVQLREPGSEIWSVSELT